MSQSHKSQSTNLHHKSLRLYDPKNIRECEQKIVVRDTTFKNIS